MMSTNLRDIAISNIKGSDYRCIISLISQNEAIKICFTAIKVPFFKRSRY